MLIRTLLAPACVIPGFTWVRHFDVLSTGGAACSVPFAQSESYATCANADSPVEINRVFAVFTSVRFLLRANLRFAQNNPVVRLLCGAYAYVSDIVYSSYFTDNRGTKNNCSCKKEACIK